MATSQAKEKRILIETLTKIIAELENNKNVIFSMNLDYGSADVTADGKFRYEDNQEKTLTLSWKVLQ